MSSSIASNPPAQTKATSVVVRFVEGWDGFKAIEPHWRRLFEKTMGADPSSVWPLVWNAALKLKREYRPMVATCYEAGELIAMVPLMVPRKRFFRSRKAVKMVGFDSTPCGMSIIAGDPGTVWQAVDLQLRDWLAQVRFESLIMRRRSVSLPAGAYVTEYVHTKQLRKVQPGAPTLELEEGPIDALLTPKVAEWIPAFDYCVMRTSSFEDLDSAISLVRRFDKTVGPDFRAQMLALAEEGDGYVAWLEQQGTVVAAQGYAQTQDELLVLGGGGAGLVKLQHDVFQSARFHGITRVMFSLATEDWKAMPGVLVEDVVIARV